MIRTLLIFQLKNRAVAILAVLLLVVLLISLLRLAIYACPWYDDLSYRRFAKAAMAERPSIIGAMQGAMQGAWEYQYARER